jgi:putative nucleotidyltransferase with HDIG domain
MSGVEGALRDLQSALAVRRIYPADHPRAHEVLDVLEDALRALTASQVEVSLFSVDGRIVVDGTRLAGAESTGAAIFALLADHGYHRLTVRRGVTRAEIEAFVDELVRLERDDVGGARPLASSDHLRLAAAEQPRRPAVTQTAETLATCATQVQRVWRGIRDARTFDGDGTASVVAALLGVLDQHAHALVPLAALKAHDDYTATHITNVGLLAMALAEAVGLPSATVRDVAVAALLHDIGKLSVPHRILNEQGRLSPEQLAVIRRHPEEGARLLLQTPGVPELAPIVAFEHHIQADGGGYPKVPGGWRVNLGSAITQVADVYDALRSNRPYRAGLPRERIAEIMTRDAGTVFDRTLVGIFLDRVMPRTIDATAQAHVA